MSLFVKSETLKFDEKEVTVNEVGIKYLLLDDKKRADMSVLLELHTSLSREEIEKLSIEAFEKIVEKFYEVNKEHFEMNETKGEKTKLSKKKS